MVVSSYYTYLPFSKSAQIEQHIFLTLVLPLICVYPHSVPTQNSTHLSFGRYNLSGILTKTEEFLFIFYHKHVSLFQCHKVSFFFSRYNRLTYLFLIRFGRNLNLYYLLELQISVSSTTSTLLLSVAIQHNSNNLLENTLIQPRSSKYFLTSIQLLLDRHPFCL